MGQKNILNDKPHLRKQQKCSLASSSGNGRSTKWPIGASGHQGSCRGRD